MGDLSRQSSPPDPEKYLDGGEAEERRRLKIARLVAESWRDAAIEWGSLQMDGRTTAHPLALVLCALDGERSPIELGISPTDPAWDAIKAAASDDETRPDAPPSGEDGPHGRKDAAP